MKNFSGLSKKFLVLTIVLFALIVALGAVLKLGNKSGSVPAPYLKEDIAEIDKNVAELNSFDADLSLFAEDDVVSQELDATLTEVGEISEATVGLRNDEKNLSSFDSDLGILSNDEAVNKEIDQFLQEVSI
ncbi:MAG: hypothetical protein Q8N37_03745 [bacterium]|nr:hypothetical protein [bacterium]